MRILRILALLAPLYFAGCLFIDIPLTLPTSDYRAVELAEGKAKKNILILEVDGVISSGPLGGDSFFGSVASTVNEMAEKLEKAKKDKTIKAVILRVDSPGGGVTASDIVYRMLRDYREETGVPVYCSMLDLAASGGYYIAMAAEEIYAHPTTVTGSIGVIAMFPEIQDLSQRLGVSGQVVKSGEMKDIGSFWRKMPPAERAIMQGLVDGMYNRFVDVIAEGRPQLDRDRIRELGDGRVYTAEQARENGLIDGIMYLDELVDYVREQIAEPKARVIMYRKVSAESIDSFYATARTPVRLDANSQSGAPSTVNLLNVDLGSLAAPKGPVFHYMWVP